MFAQKSTKLQSFIKNCKQNHIILKHSLDTRYGIGEIVTHDDTRVACKNINSRTDLREFLSPAEHLSIFIDEAQFFAADILEELFDYEGKVYFCGLDMNYLGELFPISAKLLEILPAENKLHLKAICECGNFATHSKYIGEKKDTIVIVGTQYKPVCAECF